MGVGIPQGGAKYASAVALLAPGQSAIAHGEVSVDTLVAVLMRAANEKRRSLILYNAGPGIVYPGTSAVSTANAVPLKVGGELTIDRSNCDLYLVASIDATAVTFFEEDNA